jgi:hypothetical protein
MSLRSSAAIPISQLPNATTPLTGTELVPVVQNGVTDKVSVANLTAGRSVSASDLTLSAGTLTATAVPMTFYTGGSERMRVDTSGNVGIGRSPTAGYRLDVAAATAEALVESTTGTNRVDLTLQNTSGIFSIGIDTSAGGVYGTAYSRAIFSSGAYPVTFWTASNERMRIDYSGNVGIGTNTNLSTLTVSGSFAAKAPSCVNSATYSVAATDYSLRFTTTNCTVTLPTASSYPGRILVLNTITANSVTSNASNVIPLGSNTAGTTILAATAGKFSMLQSDGTNWITLLSN